MRRRMERVCWAVVLLCALVIGFCGEEARLTTTAMAKAVAGNAPLATQGVPAAMPGTGQVLGQLQIPAIGLSVPVVEDDSTASLLRGVGHIRGTALPGGLGTVGLAGHRDTFLRRLQFITRLMEIEVSRGPEVYRYRVDSTEVVWPEEVRVLDTVQTPELVLITCYPFHYIGAAPRRFIVHAHLESVLPQTQGQAP